MCALLIPKHMPNMLKCKRLFKPRFMHAVRRMSRVMGTVVDFQFIS